MKKALYIHFEETDGPNKLGIINKLKGKFKALKNKNVDLDVISFKNKKTLQFNSISFLKLPSRILWFRYFIFKAILKKISENKYDFIYIRYLASDFFFVHFLKQINNKGIKVLIEFPTFPYDEEKNPKNFIEQHIIKQDKKYRKKIYKYTYRAVTFTGDKEILGIPTINIQNGIDVDKYIVSPKNKIPKEEIQLIAVANLTRTQAYERILYGLSNYYSHDRNQCKVTFRIVGNGPQYLFLKNLTKKLKLHDYVSFAGIKTGKELDDEFRNKDMGVGTLGFHRIGLKKGSVLKLREYTSRGLPSVIGYNDPSIKKDNPFVLQVEANESAIDITKLVDFLKNIKVTPIEIRNFAIRNFAWEKQVEKIIAEL